MLVTDTNLPLTNLTILLRALEKVKKLIGHNIKFDLAALYQDGFRLQPGQELEDTITAARMYFPDKYQSLDLETVSDTLLGTTTQNWKSEFKAYLKKNKWWPHYDMAPPDVVGEYCINDCQFTSQIRDILVKHIESTDQGRIWEQEGKLLRVLWDMEKEGLYFDREYLLSRLEKLHVKLNQLKDTIYALVGKEFDISSSKQVNEIMVGLGITSPHLTPKGVPKWSVGELMTVNHPIASLILEYRGIEKMRSTYFEPLLKLDDDRHHQSFKPWGTISGRMSCALQTLSNKSQNLAGEEENEEVTEAIKAMLGARAGQSIDMTSESGSRVGGGSLTSLVSYSKTYSDTEDTVSVRRLYIPPPGYALYCIDYEQMEMRVFADYVNDENLNRLLETGEDFHSVVAREVWKVDGKSPLWKFYRNLAKAVNFGLLYGIGLEKLASQIQKSVEEAEKYKKDYFDRFPKARNFMWKVQDTIKTRGYIFNRFGRRYTIPADKAYVGINYLCQGLSADIVKNRMIAIHEYLADKDSKIVVQIHDELLFYVKIEEELEIVPKLKEILEERLITTYMPVEVSRGVPSWAEKKKICTICMDFKVENEDGSITCSC